MTNLPQKHLRLGTRCWGAAAIGLLLTACGGGGGSSAPTTPPAAPASLTAVTGNSQNTLTWPAASGASSYNLYWANVTGVTPATGTKLAGVKSPYTHAGLSNATTYYYVATAANSAGESPATAEANAMPWITAPTGIQATPGDKTITLSWSPVAGATSYSCYWSNDAAITLANSTEIEPVTSPYTQTGLTNGTTYYYLMTSHDAHGESLGSAVAHAVPAVVPAPAAPSGLLATPGDQEVTLTWDAVATATSYNVYRATSSGALGTKTKINAASITGLTYDDLAVTNATMYYYQVTAVNSGGESVGSTEASAPVINLTGSTWNISETVRTNSCGSDIGLTVPFTATITQAAGASAFSGTLSGGGSFTGTVSGRTVTITGSEPYTAKGHLGTLDFQSSGTWANTATAITLTGSANWQFIYAGTTYCVGTMSMDGSSN